MKFNNIEQVNEVDAEGRTKAEIVALFPSVNADSIKLVGPLGSKHWEIEGAPLEYHLDQKNKEESNVEKIKEKILFKDFRGRTLEDIKHDTKSLKEEVLNSIIYNEAEKQFYIQGIPADKWIERDEELNKPKDYTDI